MTKRVIVRRQQKSDNADLAPFDDAPQAPTPFVCVVRCKMYHTALRLREEGGEVVFIPLKPEGFKVERLSLKAFAEAFPIEESTYPIERCAKLYAGWARSLGSTPDALKELSRFTPIDHSTKLPVDSDHVKHSRKQEEIVIGRKIAK